MDKDILTKPIKLCWLNDKYCPYLEDGICLQLNGKPRFHCKEIITQIVKESKPKQIEDENLKLF